jgi:cytidylate kinase
MPIGDKAFFAQASVIRELAVQGSCVIVGRCAGYILREDPNRLNVFIYAPLESRIKMAGICTT